MSFNTVCRSITTLLLLLIASIAVADALRQAEAAFARGDNAAIVKLLLPEYQRGALADGRGLYLLSRGCYFAKPSPFKGALAAFGRSCRDHSGRMTREAAQAGSIEAMLDLAYSLNHPDPLVAHPDLKPDTLQAYGWALLAEALASGEQQARARRAGEKLNKALVARFGRERAAQLMEREQNEARGFLVRLAPMVRPDLAPVDDVDIDVQRLPALGWVEIPGTASLSEFSEGNDAVYLPTLWKDGHRVRFLISLNGADAWRYARMDGDCETSTARVLRDTGWGNYGEGDEIPDPHLHRVSGKMWDDANPGEVRAALEFACRNATPSGAKAAPTGRARPRH